MPSPYEVMHNKQQVDADGNIQTDDTQSGGDNQCDSGSANNSDEQVVRIVPIPLRRYEQNLVAEKTCIRLPSFEKVSKDPVLYAHASRVLHQESNPHNARALIQKHGNREIWVNPPPIPLATEEMDQVFGFNYARVPH